MEQHFLIQHPALSLGAGACSINSQFSLFTCWEEWQSREIGVIASGRVFCLASNSWLVHLQASPSCHALSAARALQFSLLYLQPFEMTYPFFSSLASLFSSLLSPIGYSQSFPAQKALQFIFTFTPLLHIPFFCSFIYCCFPYYTLVSQSLLGCVSSIDYCLLSISLRRLVFYFFRIFYTTLAVCCSSEVGISVIGVGRDFQRQKWQPGI